MKTPTKQIYIGAPLEDDEARFLRTMHDDLGERDALILANFFIGKHQFDFVVVTHDFVALLELKNLVGPVFGGENGAWMHQNAAGQQVPYDGNPFSQTLKQKFALSDVMHDFQRKTPGVPSSVKHRFAMDMLAYVCVYPVLDSRSRVNVSEYKVTVAGYDRIQMRLQTDRSACKWDFATWREFARSRGLTPASLSEATDEKVHRAARALSLYRARLSSTISDQLPPSLDVHADNCGPRLIERLSERKNWLLLGPTGTTKSFHLEHLVLSLLESDDETPIVLRAAHFEGGTFAALLQREIAPYFTDDAAELVGSIRRIGKRPALIMDGLNECSERAVHDLLEGAQAFVLRYGGRVILSSQNDVDLPNELKCEEIIMPRITPGVKRTIYAYHAGIAATDSVDAFCAGFTNAYDLVIAGRCHRMGAPAGTKATLYDRYVRESLAGNAISGAAFLRMLAGAMADDLTFSMSRERFERLAEQFASEQHVPLSVIDAITRGRMLTLRADAVTFEHELLLAYFQAEHLRRKTPDAAAMATELRRPRNRKLLDFILPRLTSAEEITAVLATSADVIFLARVASGQCGDVPQKMVLAECHAALDRAFAELMTLGAECQSENVDDDRVRLVGVNLTGRSAMTERDQLLYRVIGRSLDQNSLLSRAMQLLDATETALRGATAEASERSSFRAHSVWGRVLHDAFVFSFSQAALPCATILAAFRDCVDWRDNERHVPAYTAILGLAVREAPNDIAVLSTLDTRSMATELPDIAADLRLVEYAWNTGHYTLRVHAMHFVQQLRSMIEERHKDFLPQVCDLLRSFQTENMFESTVLVEALSVFDALDGLPTTAEALAEMQNAIAGSIFTEQNAEAIKQLSGKTPEQARRSFAYGTISNIFEEPFSEAYYGAYKSLNDDERCTLLSLAALRDDSQGTHLPWILLELFTLKREAALPVFERFACELPVRRVVCPQDIIASYFVALRGCAQWQELPPAIPVGVTPQEQGWNIFGQIIFWHSRFGRSALKRTSELWCSFPSPIIAASVLSDAVSGNIVIHHDGIAVDFIREWPNEIRTIAETTLTTGGEAPLLVPSGRAHLREFLIKTLGVIGDESSLVVLRGLADDAELGAQALDSIAAIQGRLAATSA